jgi:hypothetical protein
MKNKIGLIIAMVITMITTNGFAQCDSKTIKNNILLSLDDYTYESFAYKALKDCENKEAVKATFSIFKNENYRIVDASSGFNGRVTINLYDSKGKLFISNVYMQNANVFDFKAKYSGNYMIEYIFSKEDYDNPKNKCIAFGIGYR